MATFPSYACILLAGYSDSADFGVLRTEMDAGIAKQRARWSRPIVTREVQINVGSKANRIAFDTWMRVDLDGGVGWFDFTDPVDGVSKQARIVGGRLSWATPGRIWIGECQLETIG